jgi:hypothetical protein
LHCPKEIQRALTRSGGERLNGEPNYKFVWSGDFTYLISNGTDYAPFRVVAEDCWLLVKYELPEFWGTEGEWEINNWESGSREHLVNGILVTEPLYTAGPYPRQGRYRNIMRIKRQVMIEGEPFMELCAPTLQWVEDFFPGVRDFLNLTTEEKRKHLEDKEAAEKEALTKSFVASRESYRGIATAKQVKDRVENIERYLSDPENVNEILQMTKRRTN